jgi:hypothetical protein
MRLPKILGVGLALAFAGMPLSASAEDLTPEQRETARFFMTEGRALRDKGNLQAALEKFRAADAIVHAPTSGLEVARAYASLGLLVEARDTALHVTRIPEQPDEAPVYKSARATAGKLSDELATMIPTIAISVKDGTKSAAPVLTRVDDDDLPTPYGVTSVPRRVNPGAHVVYARTADKEGEARVEVKSGEIKQVVIALHAGAAPLRPQEPRPAPGASPAPPPEPNPDSTARSGPIGSPPVTIAAFGVAGTAVVVGAVTGIVALGHAREARKDCRESTCLFSAADEIDAAHTFATVSTIAFVVAGATAALGIANLLVGAASTRRYDARLTPYLGLGRAGFAGVF